MRATDGCAERGPLPSGRMLLSRSGRALPAMVVVMLITAACSFPLSRDQVVAGATDACSLAGRSGEDVGPVTDVASLERLHLEFGSLDRQAYRALLDLEPGEAAETDLRELIEGIRLIRFAPSSALTAWKATNASALERVRSQVTDGVQRLEAAADALGVPECTPDAWGVAFVLESLAAAEAGVAAAQPTGRYLDDVDAACARFVQAILRAGLPLNPIESQLYVSRLAAESANLAAFLSRLIPDDEHRESHLRVLAASEELRSQAQQLQLALGRADDEAFGETLAAAQAAIDEVGESFEALDIACA